MKIRILITIFAFVLMFSTIANCAEVGDEGAVRIYLPREIVVEGSSIKLGDVSIIRGESETAKKSGEVILASFSVPGQQITIERNTIESRLSCSGIDIGDVEMSGAESITVRRDSEVVKGAKFAQLARTFLESHAVYGSLCRYELLREPKDFMVPGDVNEISFSAQIADAGDTSGYRKVNVYVLNDGHQVGMGQVVFRNKYECKTAVTTSLVKRGQMLTEENTKVVTSLCDRPQGSDWKEPYGLIAKTDILPGTAIGRQLLKTPEAETVVKRNENVVIRIDKPGLMISTVGKALQDGKVGEFIKVRNVDSNRVILARVNEDASVEPAI